MCHMLFEGQDREKYVLMHCFGLSESYNDFSFQTSGFLFSL